MILNSISLVTSDLEDSVDFYTRTLGLKEIERDSDSVSLQGREIGGSLKLLSQESMDLDAGSVSIAFTVNNLASIVYKLKNLGEDVEEKNNDDGTQTTSFLGPNDEVIDLTTAALSEMSDSEEIETRINGISINTGDVEDSVNFYTQVLGLKEIESWTYGDDQDSVLLQAGDIIVKLSSTGWFKTKGFSFMRFISAPLQSRVRKRWLETKGFSFMRFEVNNLNHSVQKLKAAGVDVDVGDVNEQGWQWVFFDDPDDIRIGLCCLVQVPDEETDAPSDGNAERLSIGEKVRFWEEQDKINQALIPRVMEMHDIVTDLHNRTANITSQIAATEARVLQNVKEQVQSLVKEAEENVKEQVQSLVKEAEARVLQNVKEQVQSLVKEAEARVLQNVKEQVQSLVKEAEARVLQNVKEQVQSLVKEAEARVLQNVKEQVQSLVKEAEARVLQNVKEQVQSLVKEAEARVLQNVKEQVQSLVKEAEARVLQNVKEQVQSLVKEAEENVKEQVQSLVKEAEENVKEQVQSLVKEAEARVLQQVNDQLPNLVQREVSQALSTIRRIAYTAVVLAVLALALILYFVVS